MNLSSLVIPVLLAGVALYGMGKRVDVYLTIQVDGELTALPPNNPLSAEWRKYWVRARLNPSARWDRCWARCD